MFKLPICPYCHTIYRYGDVKKTVSKKNQICYNCNKSFKVSKYGISILFLILAAVAIAINIIELIIFKNINFLTILITNIVITLISAIFIPYFIKYKKSEKK